MGDDTSTIDFAAQSSYSDPRGFGALFDGVEPTIAEVSRVARNVIVHYRESDVDLPASSSDEINLRWVDAILATDQARHPGALDAPRSEASRVQGCCRDHSLLCVAMLRHHAVPARTRVGFASYFLPGWHTDHVIVEAFLDGRWRRFDPEVTVASAAIPVPDDIPVGPDSPFLTASHAWLGHRSGSFDASGFGVNGVPGFCGDWFVFDYVIGEVAHRFGHELLLGTSGCRDREAREHARGRPAARRRGRRPERRRGRG